MIHLLWMVLEIVGFDFYGKKPDLIHFLVGAPASVIGIGGDHSNLSNEKDQYDHVMSPFHRKSITYFQR